MWEELLVLFGVAIIASLIREYYGNKGMFILPHNTEKGFALGSYTAVATAILAVLINYAILEQFAVLTLPIAISLGLAWGIASSDIVANTLGRANTNITSPASTQSVPPTTTPGS